MKGISVFERHFEKALLAVVAIGIGGFVAYDLLLGASHVKVNGKEVGVSELGPELKKSAESVAAAQGGSEVPFAMPPMPSDSGAAVAPITRDPVSADPLPPVMPPIASGLFARVERPVPLYHEPSFGPVRMIPRVAQSDGAVQVTAAKDDAWVAFLDRRPGDWQKGASDVIWTTPTAEVDLASIRKELERSEPDAKPARASLPLHWWQQRERAIWVLDVVFDREELQPDGSWGTATIVDALPGIATFRGKALPNAAAIVDALRKNPDMQKRILQPPPPAMAKGAASDPLVAESDATEPREVRVARRRLEDAQKKLEQATADLEAAGGEPPADPPPGEGKPKGKGKKGGGEPGSGEGDSGGSRKGGGGSGASPSKGGSGDTSVEGLKRRKRLKTLRDEARAEVKKYEDQIAAITKPVAGAPEASKPGDVTADRMLVWTHDFQVRPGATYRYRCRLQIANPFLGRKAELQDSQKGRDGDAGILTAPSEWAAVRIRNPREVFALEGMPGEGSSGLGLARFQIFKLDKGLWCETRDVAELGERVGSPGIGAGATDFTTDWFVVAVYRDLAADAEARRLGESGGDRRMVVVLANAKDPSQVVVRRPAVDEGSPDLANLARKAGANKTPAGPAGPGPKPGSKKS